ncbi:MAG: S8 family serine peptidase [Flammeovirgaceae bacterium]
MKQLLLTSLFLLFGISSPFAQHQQTFRLPNHLTTQDYDQQHLVIKLTNQVSDLNHEQIAELKKLGLTHPEHFLPTSSNTSQQRQQLNQLGFKSIFKVKRAPGTHIEESINQLRRFNWIAYAEPIYHHQSFVDPNTLNEPFVSLHWGHENANVYQAWDSTFGDNSVVIGVVDAGCRTDHPSLVDNFFYNDAERFGTDGVDDDANGYVDDSLGYDFIGRDGDVNDPVLAHGTEVAGIVTAKLNDNIGSYGVAPNSLIMPLNISTSTGALMNGYEAIVYAAENGCDIINLSWGRIGNPSALEQDIINMIAQTYDVIIVAAAGNTPAQLDFYPASYENVVSVAHITADNVGFATYSDFIDLCAPGVGIPSTTIGLGADGNGHNFVTGSSFASPFVCAAAALIKSHYPELKAEQVIELIRQTTNPDIYAIPANVGKGFGTGRLDVLHAISNPDTITGVRLLDYTFKNENDSGLIIAGNTVEWECRFVNYLNPTSEVFSISISTEADAITLLDSTLAVGILNTLDTLSNATTPFRMKFDESIVAPQSYLFKITYHYKNKEDVQFITFNLGQTHQNVSFNRITTSIDANGRMGYTGASTQTGIGFEADLTQLLNPNAIGDIGLVIAKDATQLVDCILDDQGGKSDDFGPLTATTVTAFPDSLIVAESVYGDFRSNNPIGLKITQTTRGWTSEGRSNYLMVNYSIENTNDHPIDSLAIGLFANWDIGDSLDTAKWDEAGAFGYVIDQDRVVAVKALSSTERFRILNMDGSVAGADLTDGLSKAEKYALLSSDQKSEELTNTDVALMTSQSIYNLPAHSYREVAFLLLSDSTLAGLRLSIDSVQAVLAELYTPTPPIISDTLFCSIDELALRPDLDGDYRFYDSPGLDQPVFSGRELNLELADTGKLFYVTDATLPLESEPFVASAHWAAPIVNFGIPDSLDLAQTNLLPITNLTSNWPVASYRWDFGDGSSSSDPTPQKAYSLMGNYTVKQVAVAENSGCTDSTSHSFIAYRSDYKPSINSIDACLGENVTLSPTGGSNFNFYQFDNATGLLGSGSSFTIPAIETSQTIYISTTDSVFESPVISVAIAVTSIEADFTLSTTTINAFIGDTLRLSSAEAASWEWDLGNGQSSSMQNPEVIYTEPGDYDIQLISSNAFNCKDTLTKTVTVISEEPIWTDDELGNAFTIYPNPSEGLLNLGLASDHYKYYDVAVISSIGHQVFSQRFYRSDGLVNLDLSPYSRGLYVLKITMHGATVTRRVVLDKLD